MPMPSEMKSGQQAVERLNDEDTQLLLRALDALSKEQATGEAMLGIMGALFVRGDPRGLRAMEEIQKEEADKKRVEREVLSERIILLKAKLVQMRQSLAAERLGS